MRRPAAAVTELWQQHRGRAQPASVPKTASPQPQCSGASAVRTEISPLASTLLVPP